MQLFKEGYGKRVGNATDDDLYHKIQCVSQMFVNFLRLS